MRTTAIRASNPYHNSNVAKVSHQHEETKEQRTVPPKRVSSTMPLAAYGDGKLDARRTTKKARACEMFVTKCCSRRAEDVQRCSREHLVNESSRGRHNALLIVGLRSGLGDPRTRLHALLHHGGQQQVCENPWVRTMAYETHVSSTPISKHNPANRALGITGASGATISFMEAIVEDTLHFLQSPSPCHWKICKPHRRRASPNTKPVNIHDVDIPRTSARTGKATISTIITRAAVSMAKPLPIAAVVFPAVSRALPPFPLSPPSLPEDREFDPYSV